MKSLAIDPETERDNPQVARPTDPKLIADRYELKELVAAGGMGEVHAARDLKLDRAVALKFLRRDMASQADLRTRFEAEARAAGRLNHPNVVGVFDSGEDNEVPFIVMELLSGRTLADEVAEGPATESRAREVGGQILSALQASHREGILHRDLKPGNVLLTQDGSVKVGDFGVAKMAENLDLTQAGTMLGTPAYLAPERVDGEPASESTDLYSVGVMLYELLAGRKPFDADTPLGLIRAIQQEQVPPLAEVRPDIDPAFSKVVARAMARDPQVRYSSAAEMAAALTGSEVPPVLPEPTATAAAPNPTLVMDAAHSAHPTDPTLVSRPAARRRPRLPGWGRLSRRNRVGVGIATVLIVLSLMLVRNDAAEAPPAAPTPAAEPAEGTLPAPLEDAIADLERAVRE